MKRMKRGTGNDESGEPTGAWECCRIVAVEESENALVMVPDTLDRIPGNAQYVFTTRLPPGNGSRTLKILWPGDTGEALPGFDYPGNASFAHVLPQILFRSADARRWEPLTGGRAIPGGVEIAINDSASWIAVGIPYFESRYRELVAFAHSAPGWQVTRIGRSREGRPVHAFFRRPTKASTSCGLFILQGYQHYSEWASLHALDTLVRQLGGIAGADAFAWAILPCLNQDALARGWRGDPMHSGNPDELPNGGNMNRDWDTFSRPETRAAAACYRSLAADHTPRHALDIHMGWSTPDRSGGGLTVFKDGQLPPGEAARERAFTETFFRHVPIEPFPWEHSEIDRPNFAAWAVRELGCLGQTVEISRFRSFKSNGQPGPISQDYYEALGPAMARALIHQYST